MYRGTRIEVPRKFYILKQLSIFVGIITTVPSICVGTSKIRHQNWQVRQTTTLCDLPANAERLTITVKTLSQCLAYTQPHFAESGFVTYNATSGLCTIPDPSAMPRSFGQMYESDLTSVSVEDPIPEPCNNFSWTISFKTQPNGNAVFGDKASLFDILDNGADFKVQVGENIFLESSYVLQKNSERCVATPFVISKWSWDTLNPDLYWEITLVCTDGKVFVVKQSLGVNTLISSGYENVKVTWYTRKLPEDPNHLNPVYHHLANGLMVGGSKGNIISSVKRGKSIKIWLNINMLPSVTSLQRLEVDDCDVVGQNIFRVGVNLNPLKFMTPLYWWNALVSTLGSVLKSRWYIGEHIHKSNSVSSYDLAWYVDVCWSLAFVHSATGTEISGNIGNLKAHILIGRRVRVLFDSYTMEADNIFISNNNIITAQFLSQMDTQQPMVFSDGHWKWVRISTDGSFLTDIYEMGSSTKISNSAMSSGASWFVQRREWIQMLVTSSNGTVVQGTKTALVEAIRQGSSLRCVIHFETNDTLVFTADNIEISNDGNVAAQLFRYIQFSDDKFGTFVPYWRIMLMCTTGKLQESRWTVGEHVKRGENVYDVGTHWFVDK
ncbi:uncharacterized protein LOC117329653 [Pecten maximus]|uniref:uncharacterized protein LOC117329653 n=1 Tax=Pecten maximus TaxID=6579 RepID=UPI00145809F0|nr:uncharacterized protein LOC117329653 [Pecten maximus]